jgi:hypothetical protein
MVGLWTELGGTALVVVVEVEVEVTNCASKAERFAHDPWTVQPCVTTLALRTEPGSTPRGS